MAPTWVTRGGEGTRRGGAPWPRVTASEPRDASFTQPLAWRHPAVTKPKFNEERGVWQFLLFVHDDAEDHRAVTSRLQPARTVILVSGASRVSSRPRVCLICRDDLPPVEHYAAWLCPDCLVASDGGATRAPGTDFCSAAVRSIATD